MAVHLCTRPYQIKTSTCRSCKIHDFSQTAPVELLNLPTGTSTTTGSESIFTEKIREIPSNRRKKWALSSENTLLLFLFWTRTKARRMCMSTDAVLMAWEPSMAKNSSPSRAPKNWRSTPGHSRRSAKNASEPPKNPSHRHMTASKNNVQIFKCELRREVRVHRHDENM